MTRFRPSSQPACRSRTDALRSRHCSGVGYGLGAALLVRPLWRAVEERVFDLLSLATAPGKTSLPITIIGIDDASFTQLGQRWPWPRDMHAKLVERLAGDGAAVIAFDVMFPEP